MNDQTVMMGSSTLLLLFIACAAQALTSFSDDYHMVEDLHHELDDYVSGLQSLELSARTTLEHVYEMEAARVLAKHKENSEAMLKLANSKKCQVPTLLKLNGQSDSWADRFAKCMNLTEQLVNFENLTMGVYEEYLQVRPMICEGFNNVSLCVSNKADSFINKLVCSYNGLEGVVDSLDTTKNNTVQLVESIQTLVKDTITNFKGCFERTESIFLTMQRNFINKNC